MRAGRKGDEKAIRGHGMGATRLVLVVIFPVGREGDAGTCAGDCERVTKSRQMRVSR